MRRWIAALEAAGDQIVASPPGPPAVPDVALVPDHDAEPSSSPVPPTDMERTRSTDEPAVRQAAGVGPQLEAGPTVSRWGGAAAPWGAAGSGTRSESTGRGPLVAVVLAL